MILSHKYRFIFIKTRKTAGTSIEIYLSRYLGAEDVVTPIGNPPQGHRARHYRGVFNPFNEIFSPIGWYARLQTIRDLFLLRRFYNHIPAYRVRHRVGREIWNSYFKFCVERDPWDKTLSHYFFRKNARGESYTFDEYLARADFCFNYPLYMDERCEHIIVDRVLRYENLNQELGEIFKQLGIPFDGELRVRAKSSHREERRPYWDVLTKEQIEFLADAFSKEITLHGYRPRFGDNT